MEDIFSWFLAILVIIAYFVPKVFGFLFTIGTIGAAIWIVIDASSFMSPIGKINRGFRVTSKPLTHELRQYLENLSGDITEHRDNLPTNDVSAFIIKQDTEVLIHAKQWYGLRWRRSWPLVGYVNLSSPNPVLEFRSSLPFVLFLTALALSLVLLPVVIGIGIIGFSMEIQTIEIFLQNKIDNLMKERPSS